ncbi:MAG: hypothetical protein U1E02_22535 [Hydrogenophaga sp.]|nr:hypothetical protein [Hydrogenophaga sp.]
MENSAEQANQKTFPAETPCPKNILDRCSTDETRHWLITEAPARYRLATLCTRCCTATEAIAGLCTLGMISQQAQEIIAPQEQTYTLSVLANHTCQSILCGFLTFLSHTWAQEHRHEARLWKDIIQTTPTPAIIMQRSSPETVPAPLEKSTLHDQ